MKQTQAIISTYTADVSGVCSALFELGGMTIMHDASGCNSTYNTHDEPRWYEHDSLVFISGLSEMEAIMGDDEKLICDIVEAAESLHPRFIAIAGTPIPMMTGCDIPAIATDVEHRTGIPSFGFQTNGMHSYIEGAGEALAAYAKQFVKSMEKKKSHVNILGATPLDFSVNGSVASMKQFLTEHGFHVVSTWAMDSSVEELEQSSQASVNLVVSMAGLKTAEVLRKRFGTPYVIGTPYGAEFGEKILNSLHVSEETDTCMTSFENFIPTDQADTVIIGESVMSRSLANALKLKYHVDAKVICPVETQKGILSVKDLLLEEEEEIALALRHAKHVIADPLYRPIVPKGSLFHALPHEAFSGRLYRKEIPNLIKHL